LTAFRVVIGSQKFCTNPAGPSATGTVPARSLRAPPRPPRRRERERLGACSSVLAFLRACVRVCAFVRLSGPHRRAPRQSSRCQCTVTPRARRERLGACSSVLALFHACAGVRACLCVCAFVRVTLCCPRQRAPKRPSRCAHRDAFDMRRSSYGPSGRLGQAKSRL
jgi:hypothetical protein